MLPVLNSEQARTLDEFTISNEPIASIDLMERAALACTNWIAERFDANTTFTALAGPGNNGGDALAISRLLIKRGFQVNVFSAASIDRLSDDARTNHERLKGIGVETKVITTVSDVDFGDDTVVIDGLFGSGLNRAIGGLPAAVIDKLNNSASRVVSIDVPSGLPADREPYSGCVVQADYTLKLGLPCMSLFDPDAEKFVGHWQLLDIGLLYHLWEGAEVDFQYLDSIATYSGFFGRSKHAYKNQMGRVLLIGGSHQMPGAIQMALRGALKAGAGLVHAHVPSRVALPVQVNFPEVICTVDKCADYITSVPDVDKYDVVAFGPGAGLHPDTVGALGDLIHQQPKHLILDADGLNILSSHPHLMDKLPKQTILTPHIGEFRRLTNVSHKNFYERIEALKFFTENHNCIVVLKGAYTAMACAGKPIVFNSTGNPGMATGGMGDALTGIITGLLGQCKDPIVATLCGVFIHGLAGDMAADEIGPIGLLPTDLLQLVPKAIKQAFAK
ncbi:MAG: bifunctional ADP-dependent NAD(P)H-hydrate dehydratase/NAD(P)H-hydrate epimerase [Salibacteraceae bacterium]